MTIEEHLEAAKPCMKAVQISLYGQFHFRVFYEDPLVEEYLRHALWPFVQPSEACAVAFSIYFSPHMLPEAAVAQFEAQSKALLKSQQQAAGGAGFAVPETGDALLLNPIIVDPETGAQTVSYRFRRDVFVLNTDGEQMRHDLMRVVKQLLIYQFEKSNGFLFHASAVALGNDAVLFVGRSGSGKTTLSLTGARAGAKYISNDRAFLRQKDDAWHLFGWVDALRIIRPGEMDKDVVLLADYFGLREDAMKREPTPLRTVVFPTISPDAVRVECAEIDAAQGEELMAKGAMRPYDKLRPAWPGLNAGSAIRFYTLSCRYEEADTAFAALLRKLSMQKENTLIP